MRRSFQTIPAHHLIINTIPNVGTVQGRKAQPTLEMHTDSQAFITNSLRAVHFPTKQGIPVEDILLHPKTWPLGESHQHCAPVLRNS